MANEFDWVIVPKSSSVRTVVPGTTFDYDLVNVSMSEALVYQRRDFGINLGWGDPADSSNIRFLRRGGGAKPVKYGEPIAIGVRGGRFLRHQVRDKGINLGWSESPMYEWRLDAEPISHPDKGGDEPVPIGALVGLYNSVENDRVMYDRRDWGINLNWFKDRGKKNSWGDLKDVLVKVREVKDEIGEWIG